MNALVKKWICLWTCIQPLQMLRQRTISRKVAEIEDAYQLTNGQLNGEGLAHWPEFSENPDQIMALGAEMGSIPLANSDQIAFWRSVMD